MSGSQREARKHNDMVSNLANEKTSLTSDVWRYMLAELKDDIEQYVLRKDAAEKAISALNEKINKHTNRLEELDDQIRKFEQQITSSRPTIDAINATLSKFGFDNFTLDSSADGKHYRIIRKSGEDATSTLSEGEKSFVVFLYFYHLLSGSLTESGTTSPRVAVFDDPVSSLDSDVLFIVSRLIKHVCARASSKTDYVKQVFVLTHNVYFHKEVTFSSRRSKKDSHAHETFWLLRKMNGECQLRRHDTNPISSSYELLWDELRAATDMRAGLENTMRRILEYYFTILGSTELDDLSKSFDGEDSLICRSLFSWVHAGSHSVLEDAHITPSDSAAQNALRVFREIFARNGQINHYNMMMGISMQ